MLNADLHCHSVMSDGTLTPEALAERAKANGVELWALTDHDEVAGQDRALAAAHALGLPYLTGTEISVTFAHQTVHIVGLAPHTRRSQRTRPRNVGRPGQSRHLECV
jgi:predicted metal-dependent phosphoesterase TrpH